MTLKKTRVFIVIKAMAFIIFTSALGYGCGGAASSADQKDTTNSGKPVDTSINVVRGADSTAGDTSHKRGDATPAPGKKP